MARQQSGFRSEHYFLRGGYMKTKNKTRFARALELREPAMAIVRALGQ